MVTSYEVREVSVSATVIGAACSKLRLGCRTLRISRRMVRR